MRANEVRINFFFIMFLILVRGQIYYKTFKFARAVMKKYNKRCVLIGFLTGKAYFCSYYEEKIDCFITDNCFVSAVECSVLGSWDGMAVVNRLCSTALGGRHRHGRRDERVLLVALPVLRAVERSHDLLGLQRDCGWRNIRHPCQRLPDVAHLRAVPLEQEMAERGASLHILSFRMDRVGTVVPHRRADQLALARAWQRLRAHDRVDPVV